MLSDNLQAEQKDAVTFPRKQCHKPDSHAFLDVSRSNLITEVDHKLGELLHVDDVLGIIGVRVDDLCTAGYLQGLLTWSTMQQLIPSVLLLNTKLNMLLLEMEMQQQQLHTDKHVNAHNSTVDWKGWN